MQPVSLMENIFWVGVVDWNIRYFHGPAYTTHRGTTYNSYLIVDDKVALVDTVYTPFSPTLLRNIKSIIDPSRIDYVVANHSEKDHSGALPEIMKAAPQAKIICSARCADFLKAQYHTEWDMITVKTGDQISLGSHTLTFVEAPMLHWPCSMFTYIPEKGLLLPNDAFGQHIARSGRFDDEVDQSELMQEAAKYYANILLPFGGLVLRKLDEIGKMGLNIKMIGPSHGMIWRTNPGKIIEAWRRWASGDAAQRVIIAYDTMWESTDKMAHALAEGVVESGVEARLFKLSVCDHNDVITEIMQARGLMIGSPTFNNGPLVELAPLLDDLKGLKPVNKLGLAFGSYGWSGEAVKNIEERITSAKIPLFEEGLRLKWAPTPKDIAHCRDLGQRFGKAILQGKES